MQETMGSFLVLMTGSLGFSKLELLVTNKIKYPQNTSLFFMESGHACMGVV
jgi:hypothetical protein